MKKKDHQEHPGRAKETDDFKRKIGRTILVWLFFGWYTRLVLGVQQEGEVILPFFIHFILFRTQVPESKIAFFVSLALEQESVGESYSLQTGELKIEDYEKFSFS